MDGEKLSVQVYDLEKCSPLKQIDRVPLNYSPPFLQDKLMNNNGLRLSTLSETLKNSKP